MSPHNSANGRSREYFIGVEIGPAIIRAGVFSPAMRMVGKTKLSTKPERGPQTVIERIARCISYAADECDLSLDEIRAVGVGAPGAIDSSTGIVRDSPELSWSQVPLETALRKLLSVPIRIGNVHQLGALGIYSQELPSKPRLVAAVFLGPQITGGIVEEGRPRELSAALPREHGFEALERNVFRVLPHPLFQHYRSRDFRKALRKGNAPVHGFIVEIARQTGQVTKRLDELLAPETIVLGGGILDEMKEEILQIVRQATSSKTKPPALMTSSLGDMAAIAGAAFWISGLNQHAETNRSVLVSS